MATATLARYSSADFASDVQSGLMRRGQKELPSKYLYDEVGSSLFETITVLPEYGLSRADERLLKEHAPEMIAPLAAVEGAGCGVGQRKRKKDAVDPGGARAEASHDLPAHRDFGDGAGAMREGIRRHAGRDASGGSSGVICRGCARWPPIAGPMNSC